MWGIWCKDINKGRGGWLRELPSTVDEGGVAILAFMSLRIAQRRAAKHYGFATYSEAKRKDWCEVKPLGNPLPAA